jgi:hypothetical protein
MCVLMCWYVCRMLSSKTTAKSDAVQLLERVMGQLVAQGGGSSSSRSSRNYKPHVGCDVTMRELEGVYEVGDAVLELLMHHNAVGWLLTALQQCTCMLMQRNAVGWLLLALQQ